MTSVAAVALTPMSDFERDAVAGLSARPRTLPCKYFYDERGSEIFGRICELPEYYITRTEIEILQQNRAEMAHCLGPRVRLIGLGTGAGTKTQILLEELAEPASYMPVDISAEQLRESTERFRKMFPALEVLPVAADYLQPLQLPISRGAARRTVVYFPGSTIGNFEPAEAQKFLLRVARMCGQGGGLLIGTDLQKDPAIIEAAYNDTAGVTAAFNLNLLERANRDLGTTFDLDAWRHRAVYNQKAGRIEMQLISTKAQTVILGRQRFDFLPGEIITTEYSYKYSPDGFCKLAGGAGFELGRFWTDPKKLFGLFYFTLPD